jgi:hypothetical protein
MLRRCVDGLGGGTRSRVFLREQARDRGSRAEVVVCTKSLEDIVEMGDIYTVLEIPTFALWMRSIARTFCNNLCKLQIARTNGYNGPE